MKNSRFLLTILLGLSAPIFTSCTTAPRKPQAAPNGPAAVGRNDGKSVAGANDDLDEYSAGEIADPLQPVNRVTFWINHQVYTFLLRPVSKTYVTVFPKPVRNGIYNVFENIEFPVRFVNNLLQGDIPDAGRETGKFLVNSTVGVAGIMRPSDRIPALADVPNAETGQTFAKWGVGHGAYLVLPVIGPSSLRDTVGLAGDYALNPITWVAFFYGCFAWTIPVSVTDTVAVMPKKFDQYDAATENAVDRYLAARTSYVQYRKEAAAK